MDPTHDKLVQLEDDFLHDDSTSCTSSLATSLSEDPDDLYLGAEANSFDFGLSRKDDSQKSSSATSSERKVKVDTYKLIVCKERYSSTESCWTKHTYSSIDSVGDLINARECDASDILLSLGFAAKDAEETKRCILSRFNYPSVSDHTVVGENGEDRSTATPANQQPSADLSESIHKTEEWLAYRHGQLHKAADDVSNERSKSSQTSTNESSSTSNSKRVTMQRVSKMRWKFSKSRQSSFELLLPRLKEEEDCSAEALESQSQPSAFKPYDDVDGNFSPIRESSLERNLSCATDDTGSRDDQLQLTGPTSAETPFPEQTPCPSVLPPSDPPLSQVAQLAKTSLLAARQLDSFELEEIMSNEDGPTEYQKHRHVSPSRAPGRRTGVVRIPPELATGFQAAVNLSPHHREMASESDENESSSGFDEDDVNHMNSVSPEQQGTEQQGTEAGKRQQHQRDLSPGLQNFCGCNRDASPRRHVYDVTTKNGSQPDDVNGGTTAAVAPTSPNTNCNNCTDLRRGAANRRPSNNFTPTGVVVRCSSGAPRAKRCVLVPQAHSAGADRPHHRLSNARRRRREFAARSALSGDSLRELAHALPASPPSSSSASSLVYQNGGYFYRKRRPGSSCFCRQNSAPPGGLSPVLNGHCSPRHESELPDRVSATGATNESAEGGHKNPTSANSVKKDRRLLTRASTFTSCSTPYSPA